MPTPRSFDTRALQQFLDRRQQVVSTGDLLDFGVPASTVKRWARSGGPWQRILPGVVLTHTGRATPRQRLLAAATYAGPDAVITGEHALALHGALRRGSTPRGSVHVLVPHERRRQSLGFVRVERTRQRVAHAARDGIEVATVARACIYASRGPDADPDHVRELFAAAVHERRTSLALLRLEANGMTRHWAQLARGVLAELDAGVRSAAEAQARRFILASTLPQPGWGRALVTPGGEVLLTPDAYWAQHGVALEIDSMLWHSTPEQLRRTQARQRIYAAHGVILVTVAPADVTADPEGFVQLIAQTLEAANPGASTLALRTRPA